MKTISISDTTHRAIAKAAVLPYRGTGRRLPDGDWLVEIADDTCERLRSHPCRNDYGINSTPCGFGIRA